jgi:peroxiredoxin Q/BCP
MKIKENTTAIDFVTTDIYGKQLQLSDFRGKKIYIGFFRNVSCPFCNLRVHQLTKLTSDFEKKGLKMIFLFESANEILLRSSFHQNVSPIPLVGDPKRKIYSQYGVEPSVLKMVSTFFTKGAMDDMKAGKALNLPEDKNATQSLIPADFLIDENFQVKRAHYGKNLNDHIAIEKIKEFVGL